VNRFEVDMQRAAQAALRLFPLMTEDRPPGDQARASRRPAAEEDELERKREAETDANVGHLAAEDLAPGRAIATT